MPYSPDQYLSVVQEYLTEWSRRSQTEMVLAKGKGCFVWKSQEDGSSGGSGLFYTGDMLPRYFSGPMVDMMQRLIEQLDPKKEFAVLLDFPKKPIRLLLYIV